MNLGGLRRIDSLGRIVMPKSIRKNLRIKSGDNLEIYTQKDTVIIKKHSDLKNIEKIIEIMIKIIKEIMPVNIYVIDKDKLIYPKKEALKKEIIKLQKQRQIITKEEEIKITTNLTLTKVTTVFPIIVNGDTYGSLIINSKEKLTQKNISTVNHFTNIIKKLLED